MMRAMLGWASADGGIIPFGDPQVAEWEAAARDFLHETVRRLDATDRRVVDHIVDITNDQPFSRQFMRMRPITVRWIISGEPANYRPSAAEIAMHAAYTERLIRLRERGVAGESVPLDTNEAIIYFVKRYGTGDWARIAKLLKDHGSVTSKRTTFVLVITAPPQRGNSDSLSISP